MRNQVALLPLMLLAACGDGQPSVGEAQGTLEVTPINVGFGCTQLGCDTTKVVTVRNAGKGELYVRSITFTENSSPELTTTTDRSIPAALRSGDQLQIAIQYRPQDQEPDAGVLVIEHNGKTAPGTRVGERPYQALVLVRARELGLPHLKARPPLISFGYVAVGGEKSLKVQVENDGTGTAILALEPPVIESGQPLPFTIDPLSNGDRLINPRETKTITVRFKPHIAGLFEDTLILASNDGEEEAPATVKLQGTSFLGPRLVAQPASVDFGEVRMGTEKSVNVTFRSAGSEPLEYLGMAVSPIAGGSQLVAAQFTVLPLGAIPRYLDPFQSFEATVTFKPTADGPAQARVVVNTPNSTSPSEVPLSASATNPILDLTPTSMDFGNVVEGWTVPPKIFTIRNAGTGTLRVEKIRLMPGSALAFGLDGLPTFPMDIPVGVSVTGKVTFNSGGIGNLTGTVGVYTYNESAPDKTISLKAFGRSCEDECPLPNATPTCSSGSCQIFKCDTGYHDLNETPGDGCECIQEAADPGDHCATGVNAGTFSSNGSSFLFAANKIVPKDDVDWYTAMGVDDDNIFENRYDFRVTLTGAGFLMCVIKAKDSGCLGVDSSSTAGCGITYYRDDGGWLGDDSAYYHIKVYRAPGAAPSCGTYSLLIQND